MHRLALNTTQKRLADGFRPDPLGEPRWIKGKGGKGQRRERKEGRDTKGMKGKGGRYPLLSN